MGLFRTDIRALKNSFFDFSSLSELAKAPGLMPVLLALKNRKIKLFSSQSSVRNSPLFQTQVSASKPPDWFLGKAKDVELARLISEQGEMKMEHHLHVVMRKWLFI